jgi:hypothetical protein
MGLSMTSPTECSKRSYRDDACQETPAKQLICIDVFRRTEWPGRFAAELPGLLGEVALCALVVALVEVVLPRVGVLLTRTQEVSDLLRRSAALSSR